MKKWIIKFWYVLPILMIVFMLILWALLLNEPTVWEKIVGILLLLTMILLPVSWVVLLIDNKWGKALISFLATVVIGCVLGFFMFFSLLLDAMFNPHPDTFGKAHPIPAGLAYELPLPPDYSLEFSFLTDSTELDSILAQSDSISTTEPVDSLDANTYLTIRDGSQGGIYRYDFYYGPLPAGEIYLKCYEVTDDYRLSEYRLTKASRVKFDTTTSFTKLVDKQQFTIYEGDWGDYYAARIEVWYKNAATKEEKKLAEKVYRVEGWMR